MGRASRPRPRRMGKKLRAIRARLGVNLAEMAKRLECKTLRACNVSEYEHGKREPPYPVLLRYSQIAQCSTDCLIDDRLELPSHKTSKGMPY